MRTPLKIVIKTITVCAWTVVLTTGFVEAAVLTFTDSGSDNNWINESNWINTNTTEKAGVPGKTDEVTIEESTAKINTAVMIGYLKLGVGVSGSLVIDGGSLITSGTFEFNSASYSSPGSLTIQNGGSATFNARFMVGFNDFHTGSVVIHEGTLRVANDYFHNRLYDGTEKLNTRTTINAGGLLDVNGLILNAGVMDLAGGTVIIRKDITKEATQWIADRRIVAMGGAADWKVSVTVDYSTGWTTLVATPVAPQQPLTIGMFNPAAFGGPSPARQINSMNHTVKTWLKETLI